MTTLISADGKEKRIIREDGSIERHLPDGSVNVPDKRLVTEGERASFIQFMTENLMFTIAEN